MRAPLGPVHRVEALWPADQGLWVNTTGTVHFARRPGESSWTVVVDGVRLLDRGRRSLFGHVPAPELLLRGATPDELAERLAHQRKVHCLLAHMSPHRDPSVQVE